MARKSRKGAIPELAVRLEKKISYNTAIYARLSIEDNGITGDSLENQIFIVRQYIEKSQELNLIGIWVDNGQTGTDFERPGFQALMDQVRKGAVNCIVVKDLSRFGRNYLETGNYLEKIFPYLGVRFISVNDRFDTLHEGKADGLLVPLKAILHDNYAKDISKKICTSLEVKKKSGKFMGKIPPYGYVRDPQDRYRLLVHTERAEVVRQVFRWKLEGMGVVAIARKLNDKKIPTQLQIRFQEGHSDGKPDSLWRGSSVTEMLKNPCYLGCMVERKSSKALYQAQQTVSIPKEQWKLIPDTHEAIIEEDIFYEIQELMERGKERRSQQIESNQYKRRTENILAGRVRCGICGSGVHRDSGYFNKDGTLNHYSFYCTRKYMKENGCASKAVDEKELLDAVFWACKKQLEVLADMAEMLDGIKKGVKSDSFLHEWGAKLQDLEKEQRNLRKRRTELYEDYKAGLLSEQEYLFARNQYICDCEKAEGKAEEIKRQMDETENVLEADRGWMGDLLKFKDSDHLTVAMCEAMIKQIILHEDRIQVLFTFMDEYEKTAKVLEWCGSRSQRITVQGSSGFLCQKEMIRTEVEDGRENSGFVSAAFG